MGIKEYLKKQYAEQKKVWAEQKAFDRMLAKKKKAAYREAIVKERIRIAKQSAKIEADLILKKYTEKLKKKFKPLSEKDYGGDITRGLPA